MAEEEREKVIWHISDFREELSEKEKNIALFKRGFGGFTIPLYVGIKQLK